MFVACDDDFITTHDDIRGATRITQEADGVESHLKLRTGSN